MKESWIQLQNAHMWSESIQNNAKAKEGKSREWKSLYCYMKRGFLRAYLIRIA